MTSDQAKARHAQLADELRRHDHNHYIEGPELIPDPDYDQLCEKLLRELKELEKQFPELVTSSSTIKSTSKRKSEAFKAEIKKLRLEIEHHRRLYYGGLTPEISDFEYDQLEERLKKLEKRSKTKDPISRRLQKQLPLADSPTEQVGGTLNEGFVRFKHLVPMLSLDKIEASDRPTKEEEPDRDKRNRAQDENTLLKLRAFDATIRKHLNRERIEYIIEPKVDGTSISVHYHDGKLALGVTRGPSGGTEGDDITANIKTISSIPHELKLRNPPALLEVRGEAYIAIKEFESLNAKLSAAGEKPFPNARNATSGALKQLDSTLVAQRPIRAVFYATGALNGIEFKTHSEMLEALARFGLPTQKLWWVCDGIEEVLEVYTDKIVAHYDEDHDLRRQLPYEIDGIVLKINTVADWKRIPGRIRAPGYAIVHKPVPWITPAETVLKAITVQVGRTGVLTPVAELEPVFVQGSTVSRATLHNEDEIRRKDIRIGDTVVIRKAGMVIPEIFEVVKTKRPSDAKEFDLFQHVGGKCPACGWPIAKEKVSTGGADEVAWRCQNVASCPAQLTRRLEYFAQRKALDIESLGGVVSEKLVERGLIKEPLDLFDLKLDQIAKLNLGTNDEPRIFGEKNAAKIIAARDRARTFPLARWLLALGVPSVGETTAYQIAQLHKDLDEVAHSEVLEKCLLLYEKVEEAKLSSPDSIINMGPMRKERIAKEKILESETDPINRKRLMVELENLVVKEKQEWLQRIKLQTEINSQVEDLVRALQNAGIVLNIERKEKQKRKNKELAPPILEITANIELDGVRNLLKFFETELGKKILKRLRDLSIRPEGSRPTNIQASTSELVGKAFVLTGALPSLSREEASERIRNAGGSVSSSVSKNTDYVLAGENAGSKLDKAKELGIKILSEREFLNLLGRKS